MPTKAEMSAIAAPHRTISDKIRALAAHGASRAEIAALLGKRYQHVRNVLEADRHKAAVGDDAFSAGASPRPAAAGLREHAPPFEPAYDADAANPERIAESLYRLVVTADGWVRLPSEVLEKLGLTGGEAVMARLEAGALALLSPAEGLRRARALVPQWAPGEPLWSEELIVERRREAEQDKNA